MLQLPEHQSWLDAITGNDDRQVFSFLKSIEDPITKGDFLNGLFQYSDLTFLKDIKDKCISFRRPFTLAVVHGSMDVCKVMLQSGVNVFLLEKGDYNLLHCLVCLAFYQPNNEKNIVDSYVRLCEMLSKENVARLLRMEDANGFRPLEFAAHQGTLRMMMAFWNTPSVYKVRQDIVGAFIYNWFDITEYTSTLAKDRRDFMKSPLVLLAYLDEKHYYSESGQEVLNNSIMADWMSRSINNKRTILLIRFIGQLIFACVFFVYQMNQISIFNSQITEEDQEKFEFSSTVNSTFTPTCTSFSPIILSSSAMKFLQIGLIIVSIGLILYDITCLVGGFLMMKKYRSIFDLTGKRKKINSVLSFVVYRFTRMIFLVLAVVELVIYNYPTPQRIIFLVIIHVVQTPTIITAIVSSMTVFHNIAKLNVYMRMMSGRMTMFLITASIFIAAFARLILMLVERQTNRRCMTQFSNTGEVLYTTFQAFLNMINFRDFDVASVLGLYATQMCFTFVVTVLLYNLLIALFTDDVRTVYKNKDIIACIDLLLTINEFNWIYTYTSFLTFFYRRHFERQNRQNFVCVSDRFFLVSMETARKIKTGNNV